MPANTKFLKQVVLPRLKSLLSAWSRNSMEVIRINNVQYSSADVSDWIETLEGRGGLLIDDFRWVHVMCVANLMWSAANGAAKHDRS